MNIPPNYGSSNKGKSARELDTKFFTKQKTPSNEKKSNEKNKANRAFESPTHIVEKERKKIIKKLDNDQEERSPRARQRYMTEILQPSVLNHLKFGTDPAEASEMGDTV